MRHAQKAAGCGRVVCVYVCIHRASTCVRVQFCEHAWHHSWGGSTLQHGGRRMSRGAQAAENLLQGRLLSGSPTISEQEQAAQASDFDCRTRCSHRAVGQQSVRRPQQQSLLSSRLAGGSAALPQRGSSAVAASVGAQRLSAARPAVVIPAVGSSTDQRPSLAHGNDDVLRVVATHRAGDRERKASMQVIGALAILLPTLPSTRCMPHLEHVA